jgi:hypothetical protein
MKTVGITIFLVPIIVVAALDSDVAVGMAMLSLAAVCVINVIAETPEGKVGLLAILVAIYYVIAAKIVLTWLGSPLVK